MTKQKHDHTLWLMRCMSVGELREFLEGKTLRNLSTHDSKRTDSIGFCFFPVGDRGETIEQRIRYLAGIATLDCVCVFHTINGTWLTKSTGYYRSLELDTSKVSLLEIATTSTYSTAKTEFCTTVYDRDMLKLKAVGRPYYDPGAKEWRVDWISGENTVIRVEGRI